VDHKTGFNPDIHHRRSIRLKDYDYSQAGAYFVTICIQNRAYLFGHIDKGIMHLNAAGEMIESVWKGLVSFYFGIELDIFQIMPDHIHGIIILHDILVGAGRCACPPLKNGQPCANAGQPRAIAGQPRANAGQPQGVAPTKVTLPNIIHRFKTLTTNRYISGVKNDGWPPFDGKLWQRNYYEHIIRSEKELINIREYIANNPVNWAGNQNTPQE